MAGARQSCLPLITYSMVIWKEWKEITMNSLPAVITERKLLMAAEDGRTGAKPSKCKRDLTVDGED